MNQWWGYVHQNGTIQVKRFFSQLDLDEATESPFVYAVYGPFNAGDRDEAIRIVKGKANL